MLHQPDSDFESLVARLVLLEHPEAVKQAKTSDGGADIVLAGSKDVDGTERCWQVKHYPNDISWTKCKESLVAAKKNWRPRHYTFVFPRELTIKENQTFEKHFGGEDIVVDYWTGDRLHALLTESDRGRRIARTFFTDVEEDKAETNRAIEAGGKLDTPEDALDRLNTIQGSLEGRDDFFSYPTASREVDMPGPPPTPGTVMSIEKSDGTTVSRMDMVPRDEEAMEKYGPRFRLATQDTPEGRKAAKELAEALSRGEGFTIGEGVELTPTQLPPAFADLVGHPIEGAIEAVPIKTPRAAKEPVDAVISVRGGGEDAELRVSMAPAATPTPGWDGEFSGTAGGLTATLKFRRRGNGGEASWTFAHHKVVDDVGGQVKALRFMRALSRGGELAVETQLGVLPPAEIPAAAFPEYAQALLGLMEDLLVIEKWSGHEFTVPGDIEAEAVQNVAKTARLIRDRGSDITWHTMDLVIDDPGQLRGSPVVRVEQHLSAYLLGQVVELGYVQVALESYVVDNRGQAPHGGTAFRLTPKDGASARAFQSLSRERIGARRPPPPPPKSKGRRKPKDKKSRRRKR